MPASAATTTTAQHQQMAREIQNADFAEEYFASLSAPAKRLIEDVVAVKEAYEDVWTGLNAEEQEEILNENIIRPDAILSYEGHVAIRDNLQHPSAATSSVRLSSFGVDKVFPRLQVISGQKLNTFEDTTGSQGEDLGSDCTYSYRDEHSAPWSWMTRSQQELSFESSETQNSNSDEHLETLTVASPSRVLQRQSLLIRQSKGNPLYAKPVGIPVVPALPKQELPALSPPLNKMETKPPVSPHKINNFVYEEDNRIILDFGTDNNIESALRGQSPSSESSRSSSGLLAKMKEKRNTLKKSLSNVSHNSTGTLRRKMSLKSMTTNSNHQTSPTSTLSSQNSYSYNSQNSNLGSQVSISTLKVTKPVSAPPPPPPAVTKPSVAPPPPPVKVAPPSMSKSMYEKPTEKSVPEQRKKSIEADDIVRPLAEFKIDLNTESDIPKTGFDFLDNW